MRTPFCILLAAFMLISETPQNCLQASNYDADDENSEPQAKRAKSAPTKDHERHTLLRSLAHQTGNAQEFNTHHLPSFSNWSNEELATLLGQTSLQDCLKEGSAYWYLDQQIQHKDAAKLIGLTVQRQTPLLPPSLGCLVNLKEVKAWNKGIVVLPLCLENLPKLQRLELNGNHLKRLPENIHKLSHLNTLWVYNNALSTLPAALLELKHLKNVWISGISMPAGPAPALRHSPLLSHHASERGNHLDAPGQEVVVRLRQKGCNVLYNPPR